MGIEQAIADVKRFTTKDWAVDITLTAPTSEVAIVRGLSSKHHLKINPETGLPVNSDNIHVSIAESNILEANAAYPTRDNNNEIYLKDHLVSFADSAGNVGNFQIDENFPDQTLDLIVCILATYAN